MSADIKKLYINFVEISIEWNSRECGAVATTFAGESEEFLRENFRMACEEKLMWKVIPMYI